MNIGETNTLKQFLKGEAMDERIREILNILEIDNNVLTEEELSYLKNYIHNLENEKLRERILNETTTFCNGCTRKDCCAEEECILYRIEQLADKR